MRGESGGGRGRERKEEARKGRRKGKKTIIVLITILFSSAPSQNMELLRSQSDGSIMQQAAKETVTSEHFTDPGVSKVISSNNSLFFVKKSGTPLWQKKKPSTRADPLFIVRKDLARTRLFFFRKKKTVPKKKSFSTTVPKKVTPLSLKVAQA